MEQSTHKNGFGRVLGTDSFIASDCHVDKNSLVEGHSVISYGSSITGSSLKDCHLSGADIRNSVLLRTHVSAALVSESPLEGVVIRGTVKRKAVVQQCLLSNDVTVEGCTLRNVDLSGPYLIHSNWNHTPRHYLLEPGNGVRQGIIECTEGRAHLGCTCRKISHWIRNKELLRRIAIGKGWLDEHVDLIHSIFGSWRL